MNKTKILSLLLAVAMVMSMVVVPVAAESEETTPYAIQVADASGNTALTATAGSTVELYMSSVGDCPGFTSVGARVGYPEGWSVAVTDLASTTLNADGMTKVYPNLNEDSNPLHLQWGCSEGTTNGGTTADSISYVTGNLAKLVFTIPADAAAGTYDITVDTAAMSNNCVFPHDENGVITGWIPYAFDVEAIPCTIEIAEPVAADCPEHEGAKWTNVAAADWAEGGALTTGHYKLTEDTTVAAALTVGTDQTVCIDLAGSDITGAGSVRIFTVAAGGTLTVIDSVGTGVISGGKNSGTAGKGGNVYNEGTFNLYGGTISGGTAQATSAYASVCHGGNIYGAAGSVTNIKGGTVTAGQAYKGGSYTGKFLGGGNIATLGELNISGGTISNGTVNFNYTSNNYYNRPLRLIAGNIYLGSGATMNVSGGTISGGKVSGNRTDSAITNASPDSRKGSDSYGYGGNIAAESATVNISGGTITGGEIEMNLIVAAAQEDATAHSYGGNSGDGLEILGGNLYVSGGSFNMTGGTVTLGALTGTVTAHESSTSTANTLGSAYGGNVYATGATVSVTGGKITNGTVTMTSTNSVEGAGAKTTAAGAGMALPSNTSVVIGGTAEISGGLVTSTSTATNTIGLVRGGNVYLSNNTSAVIEGSATISGGTVTDTHVATTPNVDDSSKGGNIFIGSGTVTIQGNAVVSGGTLTVNRSATRGGNIHVHGSSVLNLKDNATVTGGTAGPDKEDSRGGNIFVVGTFNMYGGTVSDGYAGWGNNVMLQNGADMNMYGGKITGGRAKDYGIYNQRGTLKIFDGVVENTDTGYAAIISDGTSATNGSTTYIFGGKVDHAAVNRMSYLHMLGGYLKGYTVSATCTGAATIYNGVTGFDPTEILAECASTAGAETFVVWHAVGTDCATCAHDFVEADGAACDSTTCGVAHVANTCAHEFDGGVCVNCEFEAPAHTADCADGCENVTWTPWDGVTVEAGGHYYLTNDLQLPAEVVIEGGAVCIDLNGYTLSAPIANRAFYVSGAAATLNVMDSSADATGTVTGVGFIMEEHAGMVYISNGAMNLYDATLTGGYIDAERGGNIYNYNGTLTIDNGKITNGVIAATASAARGANICNYGGTVVIKGENAKVTGGIATSTSSTNVYGGNYYAGTGGELYLYDGEIFGGNARIGANVLIMNGTVAKGWNSNNYMYGGHVGAVHADGPENSNFTIYGGDDYANNFYMFGGQIDHLRDNNGGNEKIIYAGVLKQDPTTLGRSGASLLAGCSCYSYDEETGLYTIGHVNGTATCAGCSANDGGNAAGYSEAHTYTLTAAHTYLETGTVCANCQLVVAKIGETEYTELTTALSVATAEDTVVLVKDVAVNGNVDIYCALDLNGNKLSASGVVDAANDDASITDSVGTGTATGSSVTMMPGNGQLAVDAANNGVYNYETVEIKQKNVVADADKTTVKFYIDKAAADTLLDDAIKAGSDVKVRITVTSEAIEGGSHSFVYSQNLVDQYASDWDVKMFTCGITGLEALGEYTITAEVVSGGVVVEAITVE